MGNSILQAGHPQSGNYWLWQIIEVALEHAGVARRSFLREQPIYRVAKRWAREPLDTDGDAIVIMRDRQLYGMPPVYTWPIDDLDDYVHRCSHVWTHSDLMPGREAVFGKFGKLVVIVRDPRDVAASLLRFDATLFRRTFFGYPRGAPLETAHGWNDSVGSFLRPDISAHFVFYERLVRDWDAELDRLLDYLELDVDARGKRAIASRTRAQTLRERRPALADVTRSVYRWASTLTPTQQEDLTSAHTGMLRTLGYPLTSKEAHGKPLPHRPAS